MAYKALYRTYRPDDFKQMAGQRHIVKTLENAIQRNQIAHAYLFCGPRGTGKTSSAKIFAKAINCTGEKKPCGVCESCLAAQNGTHPDIIEIDAASNNGVEEARNLIEKVKYAPLLGKYKIYIIDEVHMMSTGAFNALLKTIEEPPAHVIFILATTEPYKVIPTIISRCQRFDFSKVSKKEIIERLSYIVKQEKMQVDDKVLENIAILSDGGMRDALSILDQCRAYSPNHITLQDVSDIYGVISTQEICELLETAKEKDSAALIRKMEAFDRSGADIKRMTVDLIDLLKESVIYEYAKDASLLTILDLEQVRLVKANAPVAKRLQMIDILMDSYEKYRQASSVISYFEIAMLKIMNLMDTENQIPYAKEVLQQEKDSTENQEDILPLMERKQEKEEILTNTREIESVDDEVTQEKEEEIKDTQKQKAEAIIVEENEAEIATEEIKIEKVKKRKGFKDDFLLGLLVGANKPEKQKDREKMMNIAGYMLDMKYAKYASLLKNGMLIASADTYQVLSVESEALANEINDLDKNSEFLSFTNELLHKSKKIFAITNDHADRLIDLFKERSAAQTLPSAISFDIDMIVEEEEEDEQISVMKQLFEDVEVREE